MSSSGTDDPSTLGSKTVYIVATSRGATLTPIHSALTSVFASEENQLKWSHVHMNNVFITPEYSNKFMHLFDSEEHTRTMITGDVDVAKRSQRDTYLSESKDHLKSSKLNYKDFCRRFTEYKQRDKVYNVFAIADHTISNIVMLTGDIDDVLTDTNDSSMYDMMQLMLSMSKSAVSLGHKVVIVLDDIKSSTLIASTVNIRYASDPPLHLSRECFKKRISYDCDFLTPGYIERDCRDEDTTLRLLGTSAITEGVNKGVVLSMLCGSAVCTLHFPELIATQDFDKRLYVYCDSTKFMLSLQTCLIKEKSMKNLSYDTQQHLMQAPSDRVNNAWTHIFDHVKEICHNPSEDDGSEGDLFQDGLPGCRIVSESEWCKLTCMSPVIPLSEECARGLDCGNVIRRLKTTASAGTNTYAMVRQYPLCGLSFCLSVFIVCQTSILYNIATMNGLGVLNDTSVGVYNMSYGVVNIGLSIYSVTLFCFCACLYEVWGRVYMKNKSSRLKIAAKSMLSLMLLWTYLYFSRIVFMFMCSILGVCVKERTRSYLLQIANTVKSKLALQCKDHKFTMPDLKKAKIALSKYREEKASSESMLQKMKEKIKKYTRRSEQDVQNSNTESIALNSNTEPIALNSNTESIALNSNTESIALNSNTEPIALNSNTASITLNSNTASITHNETSGATMYAGVVERIRSPLSSEREVVNKANAPVAVRSARTKVVFSLKRK